MAVDEGLVVQEASAPGRLGHRGDDPGHGDGAQHDRRDSRQRSGPFVEPARRDHPACSIFHSAWIAFRPSYSHVMPYRGRSTRWTVALPTHAGEPGTVEKMEF